MAHNHTCLDCSTIVETGEFDCDIDADHDWSLCSECAANQAERISE